MKRIFAALLFFGFQPVFAQINIGTEQHPDRKSSGGEIRRNDLRSIQRTRTIFFIGEKDFNDLPAYRKAFKDAWDLTEVEFDTIDNFDKYERARNVSFITMEMEPITQLNTNLGTEKEVGIKAYYHFYIPGSRGPETFARINYFLDFDKESALLKIDKEDERMSYLYHKSSAQNWNPGLLKAYLKNIARQLKAEKSVGLYEEIMETDSVKNLANTTLYIPQYVLSYRDLKSGEAIFEPAMEVLEDYPFNYEVKKAGELGDMLLNDRGYFQFLIYTLAGDIKHISIFDSDGKLLYHEYKGNAYRLEDKDMKRLAKTID